MKFNAEGKKIIKFVAYYVFFLFIQFINSDWSSVGVYEIGKKMAYALITTVVFLLLSSLINKWSNNEKPKS